MHNSLAKENCVLIEKYSCNWGHYCLFLKSHALDLYSIEFKMHYSLAKENCVLIEKYSCNWGRY